MINRLLGIVYILMKRGTVTAKELAERYEVSTRTIYRDIETLSMAGIPVYMKKGKNGGISLTEEFVLNKMLVTKEEQEQILAALTSLQETGAQQEEETLQKLGDFFKMDLQSWVSIDFSDWSDQRQQFFAIIKEAILKRKVLTFEYYGRNGKLSSRRVAPIQLWFKEYTWYLKAFCKDKNDIRIFKLFRMKHLVMTEESFEIHSSWLKKEQKETTFSQMKSTKIELLVDKTEAYRIYDKCESESIEELPNGDFLVHMEYVLDEWVYSLILSFGSAAKVLAPKEVQEEVKRRILQMCDKYDIQMSY